MRRVLLVLLVCGCKSSPPDVPSKPWSLYDDRGTPPDPIAAHLRPGYSVAGDVDANPGVRSRR